MTLTTVAVRLAMELSLACFSFNNLGLICHGKSKEDFKSSQYDHNGHVLAQEPLPRVSSHVVILVESISSLLIVTTYLVCLIGNDTFTLK